MRAHEETQEGPGSRRSVRPVSPTALTPSASAQRPDSLTVLQRSAGNAAVSNYEGKVYAKVGRARRYPKSASRQGIQGTVNVRFTVSVDGSVSGVSIARSAGSPILDEAALQAVNRAAPFPKIPVEAGRSSWRFNIPLEFRVD